MWKYVFRNNINFNPTSSIHCIICRGKKTSHSSKAWLKRQANDKFANRARELGVPSRAYFKLEQIDEKHNLFKPHKTQCVIDLGASPGGWSLYAARKLGKNGTLISADILTLDTIAEHEMTHKSPCNFIFYQGDFTSITMKQKLKEVLADRQVDLILSDMASNFTGDQKTDALRTMSLCEDTLSFVLIPYHTHNSQAPQSILKMGGSFLCKFFSCGQETDLMDVSKSHFEEVRILKPRASRKDSNEKYLFASNFKGIL